MKQRPATVSLGDDYDDDNNDINDDKESDVEITEADLTGAIVSSSPQLSHCYKCYLLILYINT